MVSKSTSLQKSVLLSFVEFSIVRGPGLIRFFASSWTSVPAWFGQATPLLLVRLKMCFVSNNNIKYYVDLCSLLRNDSMKNDFIWHFIFRPSEEEVASLWFVLVSFLFARVEKSFGKLWFLFTGFHVRLGSDVAVLCAFIVFSQTSTGLNFFLSINWTSTEMWDRHWRHAVAISI